MTAETWRPVVGYEGCYEVSDQGRVRSLGRVVARNPTSMKVNGRILKPRVNPSGHQEVCLRLGGGQASRKVHRLVLAAFVGPLPDGHLTRHLNGIPTDNRLSNLTYGTPSENMHDRVAHGNHLHAAKTHCPQGHPYAGDNLYLSTRGRHCRTCRQENCRRFRARRTGVAA